MTATLSFHIYYLASPISFIFSLFQHTLPVSTDMIDVFLDLLFEFIKRTKWSIITDDIHDIDTESLTIDITIKIDDMNFEMSFFYLI